MCVFPCDACCRLVPMLPLRGELAVIYIVVCCVIMTSLHWGACALECFACHDLKSKFRCKTTQICNSGEVCLVQKVFSTFTDQLDKEHTSIHYNMACKKRDQCLNQYTTGDHYNVKSRFLSTCCCTDRCLEEDGTGYADYTNCYNALTYEEAKLRTGSAAATPGGKYLTTIMALCVTLLI